MSYDELPVKKVRHVKVKSPKEKRPRKPLNPVNRDRQRRLFRENFGGKSYRDWIVSLPCLLCGIEGYSEPAHLISRGAGGKAKVLAPLCGVHPNTKGELVEGCHRIYDTKRWTLPADTEEMLMRIAADLYEEFHI